MYHDANFGGTIMATCDATSDDKFVIMTIDHHGSFSLS